MNSFISIILLTGLVIMQGCATPSVSKKVDAFSGGEVIVLKDNQLDTPGFGDIYFDLEAIKSESSTQISLTGKVDYESQGEGQIQIDQTKDFVAMIDGERVPLKPIKDTYVRSRTMGFAAPLQVQFMKYEISADILKRMATANEVKMKLFTTTHRDGGFTGSFKKNNFDKLKEFLKSINL